MITLDHLLANPSLRRGMNWRGAVTHCRKGHEYTRNNTMIGSMGTRECRACHNVRQLARTHARRAAEREIGYHPTPGRVAP